MFKKVIIGSAERGILYRDKQFIRILEPGTYRFVNLPRKASVEVFDIAKTPELVGSIARVLAKKSTPDVDAFLTKVSTTSREIAVVYLNNQATFIVEPGEERLFWRGIASIEVKKIDIADRYEIDRDLMRDLTLIIDADQILSVIVPEQSRGLLFESGVLARELSPGRYAFWRAQRELAAEILDTRLTLMEVSGQEMLTKDKVSLRINLSVSYRVADAAKAYRSVRDIQGEIYRSAQLSLRQAAGEKTLDELLENKEVLNQQLASELSPTLAAYGIEVARLGVKDIILPGDMRTLLNQVVEAEKAAQAQNIRRREETAATRSLLNTARMMDNNPILLRLKELEAIERISDKVEKLTVFDGMDGIMKNLVSLGK